MGNMDGSNVGGMRRAGECAVQERARAVQECAVQGTACLIGAGKMEPIEDPTLFYMQSPVKRWGNSLR